MYIEGDTIDEIMRQVFLNLKDHGSELSSTSGPSLDLIGISVRLKNPRARLSRSESRGMSVSTIGEFLWHMSGTRDVEFISHYIPKYSEYDPNLIGAYGPRLYNLYGEYDQVKAIIELCRKKKTTRNAIIQIYTAKDINENKQQGTCTLNLQVLIRNEKLSLITTMRSNDAYLGLPHDIYSFTMLQEILAIELNCELGDYMHNVGSLHVYKDKLNNAQVYLDEGIQTTKSMPAMPKESSSIDRIAWLLEIEKGVRKGEIVEIDDSWEVEEYWKDLIRLLLLQAFSKKNEIEKCEKIYDSIYSAFYEPYIMDIINRMR